MSYDIEQHRPMAERLGFWLIRTAAAIRADHALHVKHLGIGVNEAWLLVLMRDGSAGQPGALADILGLDRSQVTRLIKGMAKRGWLRRSRRADDLRSVYLELTPRGEELADKAGRALGRAEADLRKDMGAGEVEALRTALMGRLSRTGWDLGDV